ncbi:Structural maintenance of chromosomes protein [Forsythia ovata]|uniref:Structural maintenance of chromosomes protein n=1 Tax=Forsythia ovata TaxID=205694 RepID=A0ABD1WQF0_9LAMI
MALDQNESVLDKDKVVSKEWEAARDEQNKTSEYKRVKQMRGNAHSVSGMSGTHAVGGTAYLSLENPDEPYLYGIKFSAKPLTKRYRDMSELSGGDKTVVALALLFSIHRYFISFYDVQEGVMGTGDEETKHFFKHSSVQVLLCPRSAGKGSWAKKQQMAVGTFRLIAGPWFYQTRVVLLLFSLCSFWMVSSFLEVKFQFDGDGVIGFHPWPMLIMPS